MAPNKKTDRTAVRLEIETQAATVALERGRFIGGAPLTPVQRDAIKAQRVFLSEDHPDLTRFYFKMACGTGKTGIFGVLTFIAHDIARERGITDFRSVISEPSIPLLTQTVGVMQAIRPDMAKAVGIVGDGKRDISRPITIVTESSNQIMADLGLFTDNHIDRVVGDEAHFGVSERRVRTRNGRLSSSIHIGFTASDVFDHFKSVRLSHIHKIHEISLPEALKRGVLCSYIEPITEFIPIPPNYRKYITAGVESRARLEEAAWLTHVEGHFAHALDPVIKEPMRGKYAVFFTGSTRRSDFLAAKMNNNPVLMEEARKRGLKGVSVSLHSYDGRTDSERAQVIQDILKGRYMVLCADQFGREGFDWPACKAVYLYPGMSIPDAIQTFGRASRKYFDPLKGRYEGAVFHTGIPFFSDPDPAINRANAEVAARGIVTAHHVRYDTFELKAGKPFDTEWAGTLPAESLSRVTSPASRDALQPVAFPISRVIAPPDIANLLPGSRARDDERRFAQSYKALAAVPEEGSMVDIDELTRARINGLIERVGNPRSARILSRLRAYERLHHYLPSQINTGLIDKLRKEGEPLKMGEDLLHRIADVLQTWPADKVMRPMRDPDFERIELLIEDLGRPTAHEIASRAGFSVTEIQGIFERGPAELRLDHFERLMTALTDWPLEKRFDHIPTLKQGLKEKYASAQNPSWERLMDTIHAYEEEHRHEPSDLTPHMLSHIIEGDAVVKTTRHNLALIDHALSKIIVENRARDLRLKRKRPSVSHVAA